MRPSLLLPALLLAALEPCAAGAQDTPSIEAPATESPETPMSALHAQESPGKEPPPQVTEAPTSVLLRVPALTPVSILLDEEIASNRNRNGDRFRIVVADEVRVGEVVVIPAGSIGEGEVVHAAKSGAGGKAGELILAARFVRVGDTEIKLRSMVIGGTGRDRTQTSLNVSIAAGVFGMLVRGGAMVVPAGTLATARTAADLDLPATESTAPPAEAQTEEENNEGEEDVSQTI